MPAISNSSKVLLTGGSGFLGAWILKNLLGRGFKVRATVRNESKAEFLRNLFKEHSDNLEFAIVKDITTPGAFDEAVKGVQGIIHSASPISAEPSDDPKVFIEPAVQGTVGILKSAVGTAGVERVVITSSVVSLVDLSNQAARVYTEADWNTLAAKIAENNGKDAPPFVKYSASKSLAEQAAWELVGTAKPGFDLVTVLPAYIWGEIISETTADIKGSNDVLLSKLKKVNQDKYKGSALLEEIQFVDVRDTAKLHVDALVSPVAGNERIISAVKTTTVQEIYNVLNANPVEGLDVPSGEPELLNNWTPRIIFSPQKSKDILGASYYSGEETIRNTVVQALKVGWKQ